jgi:hypothetical protein
MPHDISEIAKNWATVTAITVGGIWALCRWGYTEWSGARKNTASLDGDLTIEANKLSDMSLLVTVRGLWNNRGHFPIELDTETSSVSVYELNSHLKAGPLNPNADLGNPLFVQYPFKDLGLFELEPQTASALRAHFVLNSGPLYLFRWELFRSTRKKKQKLFYWSKEIVWSSSVNPAFQSLSTLPV